MKLFDSELKVMNVLWEEGESTARHVAAVLQKETGWNVNTTYTLIKRCIKKGAIQRIDPNFICRPLVSREEIQEEETEEFINKMYGGSVNQLFSALLGSRRLPQEEIEALKKMVQELK